MTYVYSDSLAGLLDIPGSSSTFRASHVEPGADGTWTVDLGPSGGPVTSGFRLKQDALDYEVKWLEENVITAKEEDGE